MADRDAPASASRSAFLQLRDEESLVQTGYEFLDEKRMQLATEILRQRQHYRDARATFAARCEEAAAALLEAAAALGVDALQVQPAAPLDATLSVDARAFVGLSLITAALGIDDERDRSRLQATDSVLRDCVDAFRAVLAAGVPFAARVANLERLMHEYRRTERRVRALENIILPEIRVDLAAMEEHLDLNEQEEVIRVHTLNERKQ
ncbi:MAG TPA: V-type ATP synthase subunit D [Woeseiaceae bacterium]